MANRQRNRGTFGDGGRKPPGRPVGSVNKAKLAFAALLKDIAESEEYQDSLRMRALKGDPTLDREILARVLGAVPKIMQIETPAPLIIDTVGDTPDDAK
jgi:hypothetical protein